MGRTRRFGIRETPVAPCLSPIPHRLPVLSPDSSLDFCASVPYLRVLPCVYLEGSAIAYSALFTPSSALRTLGLGSPRSFVTSPPKLATMTNMPSARVGLAYSLANLSEEERPRMAGIVLM